MGPTGIIPEVKSHTPASAPFHVCTAPLIAPPGQRRQAPEVVAGKGLTAAQAWASCVGEAVERYSSFHHGSEPVTRASWRSMARSMAALAVHPSRLLHFSARQFETRREWNRVCRGVDQVPERFHEEAEIDWAQAWSPIAESFVYIPAAYAYIGYPSTNGLTFAFGDSNGCAAGSTLEDAALQGFLELVERDAVAIWWYSRLRRPGVDLASFGEPRWDALADALERHGRSLHVLDVTTDLGIPCFAAVSWNAEGRRILLGFGCHLDVRLAVSRALAELGQALPWSNLPLESMAADKRRWMETATTDTAAYVTPLPGPLLREENYRVSAADFSACLDLSTAHGLDVLVLDLTRPNLGLPVVRMIVPGLRSFRHRLGPGRLYSCGLTEEELNPVPLHL